MVNELTSSVIVQVFMWFLSKFGLLLENHWLLLKSTICFICKTCEHSGHKVQFYLLSNAYSEFKSKS